MLKGKAGGVVFREVLKPISLGILGIFLGEDIADEFFQGKGG